MKNNTTDRQGDGLPVPFDMSVSDSVQETPERILRAARSIFAQRGDGATVREICALAEANVSAVSYYFGNKDTLLAEVLRRLQIDSIKRYPLDGGVPTDALPSEQLYGIVFGCLQRILLVENDEERELGKLLIDAYLNGLPSFEEFAQQHRVELLAAITPILQAVSMRELSELELLACARSVFAQIFMYSAHREDIMEKRGGKAFSNVEIAAIAKHITAFSLGGLTQYPESSDEEIFLADPCLSPSGHKPSRV